MPVEELIFALRRMRVQTGSLVCLGCGYEQDCSVHGCRILREAGEMVDALHRRAKDNAACEDCTHQVDLAKCGDLAFTPCEECGKDCYCRDCINGSKWEWGWM